MYYNNGCVRTKSSRIIIVEDEIIIALDLKFRLENLGHYVLDISFNGNDVLEKIKEIKPDLIFLDILLNGELDGIEVAQQIRALYNIPFIYLSGSHDNTILERAKQTKPYGYITKPFDDTEIQTAIDHAITKKSMEIDS